MDPDKIVIGMRVIVSRPSIPYEDYKRPMWYGGMERLHGKTFTVKNRRTIHYPRMKKPNTIVEIEVHEDFHILDPDWLELAPTLTIDDETPEDTEVLILPAMLSKNEMHSESKRTIWDDVLEKNKVDFTKVKAGVDEPVKHIKVKDPKTGCIDYINVSDATEAVCSEGQLEDKPKVVLDRAKDWIKVRDPATGLVEWININERTPIGSLARIEIASDKARAAGYTEAQIEAATRRALAKKNREEKKGFTLVRTPTYGGGSSSFGFATGTGRPSKPYDDTYFTNSELMELRSHYRGWWH